MSGSTQLLPIPPVTDGSEMTSGFFNSRFNALQSNIVSVNSAVLSPSQLSDTTFAALTLVANSNNSSYIRFVDSSGQRSNYRIGSVDGGTADGLNIFDESGNTMIASFSKQSVRFYQNVVGAVFDTGGALANTLNAATFGTAADSKESRIQAAIEQAASSGISRVYIPQTLYPYSASSVSFIFSVQMVREGGDALNYDVVAYGAYADGVHDDFNAFLSCHSALPTEGGTMVVPPVSAGKNYLINSKLNWNRDYSTIYAHGATFKSTSAVTLFEFSALWRPVWHGGLFDFRSNRTTLGAFLVTSQTEHAEINNVTFLADSLVTSRFRAISVDSAYFTRVNGCRFNSTGGTGDFGGMGAVHISGEANATWVFQTTFGSCVSALVLEDGNAVRSVLNTYEAGGDGIVIGDSTNNTGFLSAFDRFELNDTAIRIATSYANRPPAKPQIMNPFYTGNTSNISNPNNIPLAGFATGGLSSTGGRVSNPCGVALLGQTSSATTVTFANYGGINEEDADYKVFLTAAPATASPDPDSYTVHVGSRAVDEFGIFSRTAPGSGETISIFWRLER